MGRHSVFHAALPVRSQHTVREGPIAMLQAWRRGHSVLCLYDLASSGVSPEDPVRYPGQALGTRINSVNGWNHYVTESCLLAPWHTLWVLELGCASEAVF